MAKFELKLKAIKLRKKGYSVGYIARELGVSKSTSSLWCQEVKLTSFQRERLRKNALTAGILGPLAGSRVNHEKKLKNISVCQEWARDIFGKISSRDIFVAGIGLYWGEGSKCSGHMSFVNSDPKMVVFMYKWLKQVFGVTLSDVIPRVFINEIHRPRINKILNFWSNLLGLPIIQFRKTIFIKVKSKKVYSNYDNYYGLFSLRVRKSSEIKYKILGLVDCLKNSQDRINLPE